MQRGKRNTLPRRMDQVGVHAHHPTEDVDLGVLLGLNPGSICRRGPRTHGCMEAVVPPPLS
jgi:hypothetical protein